MVIQQTIQIRGIKAQMTTMIAYIALPADEPATNCCLFEILFIEFISF